MRYINPKTKAILATGELSALEQRILLYRRFWNADTAKYELEANPVDITTEMLQDVKNIVVKQKLDVGTVGVWRIDNMNLTFNNERSQFKEGKKDGYLPNPFILYGAKMEYYIGAYGDFDLIFKGFCNESPLCRPDKGTVDIRIFSELDNLKKVDAERVSQTVTAEQLTDISTTENPNLFKTANIGIGRVYDIKKGAAYESAIPLVAKQDYDITNLNEANLPLNIKLKAPLFEGEKLFASYIYWYQNLTVEELVNKLADIAGIPQDKRDIQPVVFKNQIAVKADIFSAQGWNGYYLENNNLKLSKITGALDDNYTRATNWDDFLFSRRKINKTFGKWKLSVNSGFLGNLYVGETGKDGGKNYLLMPRSFYFANALFFDGVLITTFPEGDAVCLEINQAGILNIYNDSGALLYTEPARTTQITYEGGTGTISSTPLINPTEEQKTPSFLSPVIYSDSFISWGAITATAAPIGVAPTYELKYRVSDNGVDFEDWKQWDFGITIPERNKYLQFKFEVTSPFFNGFDLYNLQLTYYANSITVRLSSLQNYDVFKALSELAQMSTYEIGFKADGTFFFKARDVAGENVKTLEDSQIVSVDTLEADLSALATKVIVKYGEYETVIDSNSAGEGHPNNMDKYGLLVKEISSGSLLPPDNANLADAIAPTYYEEFSKLRTGFRVVCKLDLELELGDKIGIKHETPSAAPKNYTDFTKYNDLLAYRKVCKVVGVETNFEKRQTILDLVDYTTANDIPAAEPYNFVYQMPMRFEVKK